MTAWGARCRTSLATGHGRELNDVHFRVGRHSAPNRSTPRRRLRTRHPAVDAPINRAASRCGPQSVRQRVIVGSVSASGGRGL